MSDQSPPPKPKVGSLRDRIAAFEKSASSAAPAPPPPRPKPAGFASWKPKPPSPPDSPSANASMSSAPTAASSSRAAGMSASDAMESITKGGSLKERMAALQGKGAFGAPPPVAAKPPLEKPKWKPPPNIAPPIDDDDHAGSGSSATADIAAAVERTISPPTNTVPKSTEPVEGDLTEAGTETEAASDAPPSQTAGEDEQETPVDPEEEERQRRAAIAARMARLGGARLGMAPPIIGKKPPPPPKKSTSIHEDDKRPQAVEPEIARSPEPAKSPEIVRSPEATIASPEPAKSPEIHPTEEVAVVAGEAAATETVQPTEEEKSEDVPAAALPTQSSVTVTTDSPDANEPQAPKVPVSMPVPSVPRRAGPPRKKPVKPVSPPPEAPEESVDDVVQPTTTAVEEVVAATLETKEQVEEEPAKVQETSIKEEHSTSTEEKSTSEVEIEADKQPQEVISDETQVDPTPTQEKERTLSPEPVPSRPLEVEPELIERKPSLDVADDKALDEIPSVDHLPSPPAPLTSTLEESTTGKVDALDDETEASQGDVTAPQEEEEDDEIVRKRNIAERLAKMGGINPFAPPPPVKSPPPASPPLAAISSPEPTPSSPPPIAPVAVPLPTSPPAHVVTSSPPQVEKAIEVENSDEPEYYEAEDRGVHYNAEDDDHPEPLYPVSDSQPTRVNETPHIPTSTPSLSSRSSQRGDEDETESHEGTATPAPARSIPLANPVLDEESAVPPTPPARQTQLPPRRFVPQTPEERDEEEQDSDAEMNESMTASSLFIPPPTGYHSHTLEHPRLRYIQDDDDMDGDGSESDIAPIPVPPQRRSMEMYRARENAAAVIAARAGILDSPRSPRSEYSETESDHDGQALPIPPRHFSGLHLPPPRLVPPPPPSHPPPPHIRQRDDSAVMSSSDNLDDDSTPPSPRMTPSVSVESAEILDESQGDPIDPSFHSPSRQNSHQNLREASAAESQTMIAASTPLPMSPPPSTPTPRPPPLHRQAASPPPPPRRVSIPPPPPPAASEPYQADEEEDTEQARRRTIAERMAKLGGIKFGGAPHTRTPPVRRPTQDIEEQQDAASSQVPEELPVDLTEEEEERARKERIASKLMGMGGMRIGMMPMGRPPVRSHVLTDEQVPTVSSPPAPPARAVPPARSPPPPAPPLDDDSEHESAAASEDGVKVEAEESEMEEVGYDDLADSQILEEVPPPPPSRANRGIHKRDSTEVPLSPPASPPPPPARPSSRPPIPSVSSFTRRNSAKTTSSSNESASQTYNPPSEYVMVEEAEAQDEEETPPPPPARPSRSAPQAPPVPNPSDSISSQWELPSIPTSSFESGGNNDLTMSWTDAGEFSNVPETSASDTFPQPPPARKSSTFGSTDSQQQFSADDLIVIWGRVGVQVCEAATSLFEKSKRSLIGDGSFAGFVHAALSGVPNVAPAALDGQSYGCLIYQQNGPSVQKRVSDIMPGDILEIQDGKFKGHKGLQIYHREVGGNGEVFVGVVGEFEAKKMKMKVLQANQHVGQQTVESVSYKLDDLKSGILKVYRVLEA